VADCITCAFDCGNVCCLMGDLSNAYENIALHFIADWNKDSWTE
jgi:hypothetical protein